MSDKYGNKNGYNSGDFKRNSSNQNQDEAMQQDGEDGAKMNERAGEYMKEVLSEKVKLNTEKFPIATKLLDEEVSKVQASGRAPANISKYVDVFREKPLKVTVKVLVPIKEHPKFNFVGKLLGPKGNTMKMLQEETMCKMAVLGRGSMRDRQKEEELRNSSDPKYSHLTDELHVEISALAPPAEAHARIAYALAEVKKYMVPDPPMEMMRPPMPRDLMDRGEMGRGSGESLRHTRVTATAVSSFYGDPVLPGPRPGPGGRGPPRMPPAPPMGHRPPPGKAKVISILDRARSAMDSGYGYEDPYAVEPPVRGPPRGEPDFYYGGDRNERFYEDEPYYKSKQERESTAPGYRTWTEPREFKASARDVGTRRPARGGASAGHGYRAQPYARPTK